MYVEEGFQLLDQLVDWCGKHNVYVIIDMHGAPGGQTGATIDDSRNDQPELLTDKKNQDRLVDLWVKIAGRYKDEPTIAGTDWSEGPRKAIPFSQGANRLKVLVKSGVVSLDWIAFNGRWPGAMSTLA